MKKKMMKLLCAALLLPLAACAPDQAMITGEGTQDGEDGWIHHTAADDKDTYSVAVMQTNLNTFGALAIYLDQTPALKLDLRAACDDLQEALDTTLAD